MKLIIDKPHEKYGSALLVKDNIDILRVAESKANDTEILTKSTTQLNSPQPTPLSTLNLALPHPTFSFSSVIPSLNRGTLSGKTKNLTINSYSSKVTR